ncbi:hypothetical protein Tco_0980195 [Tanacetum coccineum]
MLDDKPNHLCKCCVYIATMFHIRNAFAELSLCSIVSKQVGPINRRRIKDVLQAYVPQYYFFFDTLFLSNNAPFVFLGFSLLCAALTVSQPLVSEWQWLLGDSDHSALSCDSEEEWMVNEKNDVDEASSVSVDERNSLPSEEDSNSLLSDRTIQIDGSPNMVGDAIHFNTKNPCEPSELETSDNHNVAKELNADFIEENISTNIGTLNNAAF